MSDEPKAERPSSTYVAKMIRNMLANEFGLTPAKVQEMVLQVVERKVDQLVSGGTIDKVIERLVNRQLTGYRGGSDKLREMVTGEVKRAVADKIERGLELEVRVAFPKPATVGEPALKDAF